MIISLSLADVFWWCRQEWESQKPLRNGTPRRVANIASRYPTASQWATVSGWGPCSSFFLSPDKDGALLLFNADAEGAEPVTLGLRVRGAYKAFVRTDGLLCIVHAAEDDYLSPASSSGTPSTLPPAKSCPQSTSTSGQ